MTGSLALRQTHVLFIDAVRRLRAAKLFWIALALSLLVSGLFAIVGIDESGLNILFFGEIAQEINTNVISAEAFYKFVFLTLGVGIWLAWAAIILALISTADLIPSLIADGSADLYLSRPLNRVRLLLTRYVTGLLFVALQATCFAVASIVVFQIRGGVFLPGLLWCVPMVVAFFSLLYCISSLVGLLTGSSVAAILVTLLVWFLSWGMDTTDQILLSQREQARLTLEFRQDQLDFNREQAERMAGAGDMVRQTIADQEEPLTEAVVAAERSYESWWGTHRNLMWFKAPLPKTGETLAVLRRQLVSAAELEGIMPDFDDEVDRQAALRGDERDEARFLRQLNQRAQTATQAAYDNRPLWWSIGTSFGFQGVLLAIACWVFGRRDL
ncbi:MAG: hypothetical protein AAF561_13515 [Planctomycetota bacterium]